jgi:hypothetical protein
MANFFTELVQEFEFNPTTEQWSGKRQFLENPNGTFEEGVNLPELGDQFPPQPNFVNPINFIARIIRISNYNNVPGAERVYNVQYSTKNVNSSNNPDPETEPESLTLGSEIIRVENQGSNNSAVKANGVPVQSAINLFVLNHVYQKTTVQDTFSDAITDADTSSFQKLLSSNPNWLYSGADIDLYIDDEGEEKARSVRTYTFKQVSGSIEGPAVAADSWNLVWNSKISKWQLLDPATFSTVVSFPDTMPF